MEKRNQLKLRTIKIQDIEILSLLDKRSVYAFKQQKIVNKLKKLQNDYTEQQKIIDKFNKEIIEKTYEKVINQISEFEDIYEITKNKKTIDVVIKDVVEELKIVAKNQFMKPKLEFLAKKENTKK